MELCDKTASELVRLLKKREVSSREITESVFRRIHERDGEINAFITYLVKQKNIAASTQNQAISSILFLYRHVLEIELDETALIPIRPAKPKRVPTVLSKGEVRQTIAKMDGLYRLLTQIMYGSGLRLMEVLRLRVKDLDFQNHQIIVRDGKGENDRVPRRFTRTASSPAQNCQSPT